MVTVNCTFEDIISFKSLYKAHRRARLCKRWKKEVIEFEANLSENLWKLHHELKYGKYEVGGYHKFMIYDPKEREIQAITYRDRIVQHSLCDNYLIPILEKRLIYDNCACRKNKGTSFAYKRFRGFLADYYKKNGTCGYFVKLDVKKYFPNIDHAILLQKISGLVNDADILGLITKIINSYQNDVGKGLPMGNQTSQCFALFYLDDIDRYIKEKLCVHYYLRYMDDMIAIVGSKAEANKILQTVKEKLIHVKLMLNPKSQSIPLKNGMNFLGWRFFVGKSGAIVQKVRKSTKQRIINKIRATKAGVKNGDISDSRIPILGASYYGHLMVGNAHLFFDNVKNLLRCVS